MEWRSPKPVSHAPDWRSRSWFQTTVTVAAGDGRIRPVTRGRTDPWARTPGRRHRGVGSLRATIRLNHAVIYRGRTQGRDFATVAIKQLYATHYFQTALDVSVCVQDRAGDRPGFYLLTLKGSQQDGLTGVRGSLLRKAVVDRTRTSLERALASIKQTVEHSAAGG